MQQQHAIRNFVIIAHIDHGKSTLADRFLEVTHTVEARSMKPQVLDQMDLERERGITIKMQPVRMQWEGMTLNLIDTPGHIDFSYEVSRALAAVEGAILLVDATQGVQAQTLSNLHIAKEQGLVILPALNKIDMAEARIDEAAAELGALLAVVPNNIHRVSAKTGAGVEDLLRAVTRTVPAPQYAGADVQARALIFDSAYESHKGVIAYVRVFEGTLTRGDTVRLLATETPFEIKEVGIFAPARRSVEVLFAGEIGYVVTGIKEPTRVHIGDTLAKSNATRTEVAALPGYREPKPMIWASFYPESQDEFVQLADALERLKLNDPALTFEVESSPVMGRSFACGFLGMLHLEIVTERLKREFRMSVVTTSPSIAYEVTLRTGEVESISSPVKFPSRDRIASVREPWLSLEIITPARYLSDIMKLVEAHEGAVLSVDTFGKGTGVIAERLEVRAEAPLREIVVDFFDALKSASSGYASMYYEEAGLRDASVERMDVLVADDMVPAFSRMISKRKVDHIARETVRALKDILPRQMFQLKIQAVAAGRIIASETLSALKKDVTGYLYGGDRTRKMKLWKKQKEGKKRLKESGRVSIPPDVFLKMLKK